MACSCSTSRTTWRTPSRRRARAGSWTHRSRRWPGLDLQARLPKARVVYVSATGATEVNNLAYAARLGLWGEGTPFPGRNEFLSSRARRVAWR
jgi:hypothetical protein